MAFLFSRPFSNLLLLSFALPCCLAACQSDAPPSNRQLSQDKLITINGQTMGTTYQVKLNDPQQKFSVAHWQQQFDRKLEHINQLMSTYQPDSEISRFNASESTDWFPISQETLTVITQAQQISEMTNGGFDITVGPLVNLWNFGPEKKTRQIPADKDIEASLKQVGYQKLKVRNDPPAMRKTIPQLQCDLSAIAKGFAVDQLCELLEAEHLNNYMVEIGGEVRTSGNKAGGKPWQLGIAAPTETQITLQRVIKMNDQALATSGDYRNFYEIDGKRYSHTIDPRTGKPVQFQLAAVSVLAERCMVADAWATAMMVVGPDTGYNLALKHELEVLLLLRHDGKILEKATPGFHQQLVQNKQ